MERTSFDLETLKDIPVYRVILKTVLHNQIQQLVEQLSQCTEEEVVFLSASLGDGTISHIGSKIGKKFLQENEDVKSRFLAFSLKKQHEALTFQQPKQNLNQSHGPVPVRLTGRSTAVRHSPYMKRTSVTVVKKPPNGGLDGSSNQGEPQTTSKRLETVCVELADVDGENDHNLEDIDETNVSVFADVNKENVQKSDEVTSMDVQTDCVTNDIPLSEYVTENNSDMITLDPNVIVKVERTTESDQDFHSVNMESGLESTIQNYGARTSINLDLHGQDTVVNHVDLEQSGIDWSSTNRLSTEIRSRKRQIPIYAKISRTQTNCPYCDQNYANHANLKRHIRKHEGIYPYKCEACQKKFTDPTIYKRHVQNQKLSCWEFYSSQNNCTGNSHESS